MVVSSPGQLPKWPNGADCKSAVFDFGGSNPSLPTVRYTCPCGAEVAHSLGKTGVMGSIPITGSYVGCNSSLLSRDGPLRVTSLKILLSRQRDVQVYLLPSSE